MFTSEDSRQLNELMNQNSHNYILIKKLLDSHQFTISKIGHEIRNPLTLVSSTLQLIQKQHPETKDFPHWSQVLEDIAFMQFLLEDLSTYNNGSQLKTSFIHTSDFMNHMVVSFATTLVDTAIELTSEIDQNLPIFYGDALKLREMFLNLLQNAFDAVGPHGNIHVHCYHNDTDIITEITDDGCGIDNSQLADIFTPFKTYKNNGTGLGLAIVRTIAESHHGSVKVTSVPNVRTTFTVTLPIKQNCS